MKNNKSSLTLNKTSEELKNAPTIDKNHMPDFTEMKWKQTVDDFFGVRTLTRQPERTVKDRPIDKWGTVPSFRSTKMGLSPSGPAGS